MENNNTYETFAYVDAFNQYHSLLDYIRIDSEIKKISFLQHPDNKLKWNDLRKLIGFFNDGIVDKINCA